MTRSYVVLLALVGLMLVACTGEDGAGDTATPPAGIEEASWSEASLDRTGITGLLPSVLIGPEQTAVVAFQREVAHGELVPMVARCLDSDCSESETVALSDPILGGWLYAAALHADGSPVLVMAAPEEGARPSSVLLTCAEPSCTSVIEERVPISSVLGLAIGSDGLPVLAHAIWDADGVTLALELCQDRACGVSRAVELADLSGEGFRGRLRLLPDGSPVVFIATGTTPDGADRVELVVCADPACTAWSVPDAVDEVAAPVPAGLPVFAYLSTSREVRVVSCLDDRCSRISDREVYRQFDAAIQAELDATGLTDGSVLVTAQVAATDSAADEPDWQLVTIRCDDPACEGVTTSEGASRAANQAAVAALPDGGFVAVSRSGRSYLCDFLGEDCVDPDSVGLSQLWVTVCHGRACGAEAAPEPYRRPPVDVARPPFDIDLAYAALGDIWVLEAAAVEPTNLTTTFEVWEGGPAWSPDGTRIAYHSDVNDPARGRNTDIHVMAGDGSDVMPITEDPATETWPAWSPDGTHIAFSRQSAQTGNDTIVVRDLATGEEVELVDDAERGKPAWSPDGTRIAFSRVESGACAAGQPCTRSIHVIDVDGTNETRITDGPWIDAFPAWSPDGTRIAFHTTRDDPIERLDWEIFVVEVVGGDVVRITDAPGFDQFPTWSADGTTLLFSSTRAGVSQLYTTTLDGMHVTLLAGTEEAFFPALRPPTTE